MNKIKQILGFFDAFAAAHGSPTTANPFGLSRRQRRMAGCNYRYRTRPPQGEKEKARRRRQIKNGVCIGGAWVANGRMSQAGG